MKVWKPITSIWWEVERMSKLFREYLFCLKRSRLFWNFVLFAAVMGVWIPVQAHQEMLKYDITPYTLESRIGWHLMFVGFILSALLPWVLGKEYSDGTIRNKLVAGYTRKSIYLASLATSVLMTLLLLLVHHLVLSAFGIWLIAPFAESAKTLLTFYGLDLLVGITFSALYTMIVMQNQNKSAGILLCVAVNLLLFAVSFYIASMLAAPEMVPLGYEINADGINSMGDVPNPKYLRGTLRNVYEWFDNFLPYGQVNKLTGMDVKDAAQMALSSLAIIAVSTLGGMALFQKKDLK